MGVSATLRHVRLSAQKARLIVNQVRGMPVARALDMLEFSPKKSAKIVKKVCLSAIANAEHNAGADVDELWISTIYVDQGSTLKRMRARAKGRGTRILKPTCHITVEVSDEERKKVSGKEKR